MSAATAFAAFHSTLAEILLSLLAQGQLDDLLAVPAAATPSASRACRTVAPDLPREAQSLVSGATAPIYTLTETGGAADITRGSAGGVLPRSGRRAPVEVR